MSLYIQLARFVQILHFQKDISGQICGSNIFCYLLPVRTTLWKAIIMNCGRGSYRLLNEDRQSEDSEKLNHKYSPHASWHRTALVSSLAAILCLSVFFNVLLVSQSVSRSQSIETSHALDDALVKGAVQQSVEEPHSPYGVYIDLRYYTLS